MGATTRKPAPRTRTTPPGRDLLDLTAELEAAQARLQTLQSQVESLHAQAALGTVAGMLAHEFNNVLTPVVTYAQMALAQPEDAELTRKALERSLAACEQVTRVSTSILRLAKSRTDSESSVPRGTSQEHALVLDCIQRAIDCLGRDPRKDGIDLEVDCADELCVMMPPDDLVHVLVNALMNGRTAIGSRRGRLSIRARAVQGRDAVEHSRLESTDEMMAEIAILDSGEGLAPEKLQRLFTDLASSDGETGDDDRGRSQTRHVWAKGSGFGTLVMQRLVAKVGGCIRAESRVGRGTTITIIVPMIIRTNTDH